MLYRFLPKNVLTNLYGPSWPPTNKNLATALIHYSFFGEYFVLLCVTVVNLHQWTRACDPLRVRALIVQAVQEYEYRVNSNL